MAERWRNKWQGSGKGVRKINLLDLDSKLYGKRELRAAYLAGAYAMAEHAGLEQLPTEVVQGGETFGR